MNRLEFTKTMLFGGAVIALAPNLLVAKPEVPSLYTPEVFDVLSHLFADDTNQIVIIKNKLFLNIFGWDSEEALEQAIGLKITKVMEYRERNLEFHEKHFNVYYHPETFTPFSQFSIDFDNMVEMGEFVKKFPKQDTVRYRQFIHTINDLLSGNVQIGYGGIIMLGDRLSNKYFKNNVV